MAQTIQNLPIRDTQTDTQQQKLAKKIKNFIYDPSQVIGSGFSSKVFKGANQLTNQPVAIKVIELSKIQNQVQKYLLNNQINALRSFNHPNILKTIDILMTKNNVYIVTEFCEMGDLQQMIKNGSTLKQKHALTILKDVVQGYVVLEQKNVIHRDLKTANIFLTSKGAKIADFGFCQFVGQKKPQIAYNVGSPAYMSPQSYKQNFYSHKSDIWGIGIILYQMLIGQTPQKNLTYTQMSTNLMNGVINCGSNEQIKKILALCFKKDLKQRIDSKNLLNMINRELQRLNSINYNPHVASQKTMNINPTNINTLKWSSAEQNETKISTKVFTSMYPNMTLSTDQKTFGTKNSQAKINTSAAFIGSNKQFSVFQPEQQIRQNQRFSLQKQPSSVNVSQNQNKQKSNKRFKPNIQMLLFIFRLLKYICQMRSKSSNFLKLILFRHRNYIDQCVEQAVEDQKINKNTSQLYKQFQYLKMRFDQFYLEKQISSNQQQNNHQYMNMMNQLANKKFVQSQCVNWYRNVIKNACLQLAKQISQNRSNSFVVWDYLMLLYQIYEFYTLKHSNQFIVNQKIPLDKILKEQPKNLAKPHIQLLKLKNQQLFKSNENIKNNEVQAVQNGRWTKQTRF